MRRYFLIIGSVAVVAAIIVVVAIENMDNEVYDNGLLYQNIEALSENENSEYPRYKNVTDKSSNTEFKTEIRIGPDSTKVSVEYKRTCTVWYTHCKHTGKEKDLCYQSLNGIAQGPCGSWEPNSK